MPHEHTEICQNFTRDVHCELSYVCIVIQLSVLLIVECTLRTFDHALSVDDVISSTPFRLTFTQFSTLLISSILRPLFSMAMTFLCTFGPQANSQHF
jgi:hypothetical protein